MKKSRRRPLLNFFFALLFTYATPGNGAYFPTLSLDDPLPETAFPFSCPLDPHFFSIPQSWRDVRWDLRDDAQTTARKIELFNAAIQERKGGGAPWEEGAPSPIRQLADLDLGLHRLAYFITTDPSQFPKENYEKLMDAIKALGAQAGPWADLKKIEVFVAGTVHGAFKKDAPGAHLEEKAELAPLKGSLPAALNFLGFSLLYETPQKAPLYFYELAQEKAAHAVSANAQWADIITQKERLFCAFTKYQAPNNLDLMIQFFSQIERGPPKEIGPDPKEKDEEAQESHGKKEEDSQEAQNNKEDKIEGPGQEKMAKDFLHDWYLWLARWGSGIFHDEKKVGKIIEIYEDLASPDGYNDPQAMFELALLQIRAFERLPSTDDRRGHYSNNAFKHLRGSAELGFPPAEDMLRQVYEGTKLGGTFKDRSQAQKMTRRAALSGSSAAASKFTALLQPHCDQLRETLDSLNAVLVSHADADGLFAQEGFKVFEEVINSGLLPEADQHEFLEKFAPSTKKEAKAARLAQLAKGASPQRAEEIDVKPSDPEYQELAQAAIKALYEKLLDLSISPLKALLELNTTNKEYPPATVLQYAQAARKLYQLKQKEHMQSAIEYLKEITKTKPRHGVNGAALEQLAAIYEEGIGVPKDPQKAYNYLALATQGGQIGKKDVKAKFRALDAVYNPRTGTAHQKQPAGIYGLKAPAVATIDRTAEEML